MVKRDELFQGNGVPREQRVDSGIDKALNELERVAGKDTPCPICGGTKWALYPHEIGIPVTARGMARGEVTSLNVVALFCVKCWFIRLHGLSSESD